MSTGGPAGASGVSTAGTGSSAGGAGSADTGIGGTDPGPTAGTSSGGNNSGGANAGGVDAGGTNAGGVSSGSLLERLTTTDVTTPAGVKPGVRNYRIWGSKTLKLAPVYAVGLADCGSLVCYTSGSDAAPNARAVRLDANDHLVSALDLGAGLECRGIAAEADGHFGALLWSKADEKIFVKRFDLAGAAGFSTELTNADNHPTDFEIGEARLELGDGKYGAYYHVHSDSGHEGDTLKFVAAATGAQTTQWDWGCSHSMSELLTFNPTANSFLPLCVTDCYPGTGSGDFAAVSKGGIYADNKKKVLDVDAGCNGSVAGELGGAAVAPSGWKIVFNAHQAPVTLGQSSYVAATMNQDIGLSSLGMDHSAAGGVVWLTSTAGVNEADSAMARWQPAADALEQYVVGWFEPPAAYKLSRVDTAGKFLEGPTDVASKARWGQRDDPFRTRPNGDIVWAWFDSAGSTTLHVARLAAGGTATCTKL
jgi:hypothetical protein